MSFEYLKKREKIRLCMYFIAFIAVFGSAFAYTYMYRDTLKKQNSRLSTKIAKIKLEAVQKSKLMKELNSLKSVQNNIRKAQTFHNHNELQQALQQLVESEEFYAQPILLDKPYQNNQDLMAMRISFTDKIDTINNAIYNFITFENCSFIGKLTIIGGEESRHNCELECQFSMGGKQK